MSESKLIQGRALTSGAGDSRHIQELVERADALKQLTGDENGQDAAFAVVPAGHSIAVVDQERLREDGVPGAARGTAVIDEIEPFTRYVNAHAGAGTTVWLRHDPDSLGKTSTPIGSVTAVLDDHRPVVPGWGEHRAELALRTAPTWRHWLGQDDQWMDQETFSAHLRQGLTSIVDPDASTVLEIAEALSLTSTETVGQTVRAGGQINVDHKIDGTATSTRAATETTEIPEVFTLAVAPFLGAEAVELTARLKYRLRNGALQLGYVLVRPLEALRDAFDRVEHDLKTTLQNDLHERVYRGTPITVTGRDQRFVAPAISQVY